MRGTDSIDNRQDVIDSRDVIERIKTLTDERDSFEPADVEEGETPETWADNNPDDAEELKALESLAAEASGAADWKYGEAMIRDSYFKEYAQQLADDIGAINKAAEWPNNCIDWDEAAELLQQDYWTVDFDGVQYWIRG